MAEHSANMQAEIEAEERASEEKAQQVSEGRRRQRREAEEAREREKATVGPRAPKEHETVPVARSRGGDVRGRVQWRGDASLLQGPHLSFCRVGPVVPFPFLAPSFVL